MSVVLVLAVVAVLAVVGVLVFALRRKRRSCVVLYGPCGSGKTALWYRLKTGKFLSTVSSMKENEGTFPWGEDESQQPRHTVDIPGHGRLRWRLKDFLPIAEAIVVVLDSTAMGGSAYCRDAANMVWDVIHVGAGPRIVIACNKSDDILALSSKRVKALLEKDLSALARTRSKYPAFHEGDAAEQAPEETVAAPGDAGFTFEGSSPVPVEFVVTSVKRGGGELKALFEAVRH